MRNSEKIPIRPSHSPDRPAQEYLHNASAQRVDTDAVIAEAIREQYPHLHLTITPEFNCNLLSYAASGHALATPLAESNSVGTTSLQWKRYAPPAKRLDNEPGVLFDQIFFGRYTYSWKDYEFLLYFADGRDGLLRTVRNNYILSQSEKATNELIVAASQYGVELHDEIFVFDGGYWRKSKELWQSAQKALWKDVILDDEVKKAIVGDVQKFFNSKTTYANLGVPWKRGIIYYGPPGNGKTISIKATMHTLYNRDDPVPTLYVRSLVHYAGPEAALSIIFSKARETAPCYLVFEDLDSIVTDRVRSYFLNEVDGLENNDGILMVGSTNHLDRLDPGLSKRPSRFDRKYHFPDPNMEQRVKYCEFWQSKLSDNDDIEFPDEICAAVAKITDGFSFAYIQEAFVGALLVIAAEDELFTPSEKEPDDELDKYILWRQIKKQIKILRDEMGDKQRISKEALTASQGERRLQKYHAVTCLRTSSSQPRNEQ